MPYRTPFTLAPDEVCIDYETDITAGDLEVNDAYDLYLISKGKPIREYKVVCFMNLQFFFEDSSKLSWTDLQKKQYVADWEARIKAVWNRKILRRLTSGVLVVLEFSFNTRIGGFWVFDHWEVSVKKTAKPFEVSYVNTGRGNTVLDDKDFVFALKDLPTQSRQRGAVHEFGHMLGLDDEYDGGKWISDKPSVMNSGEVIKERHLTEFRSWLNNKLQKHQIK